MPYNWPVVLQTHGQTVLIVQVDHQVVEGLRPTAVPGVPGLTDDLRAVEGIIVPCTIGIFCSPDALVIVLEGVLELPGVHGHLHELAAAPGQGVAVVGGRVAHGVIRIGDGPHLGQPVASVLVLLHGGGSGERAGGVVVGLPGRPVAGIVIDVHVGLAQVGVILPGQLARRIVGVPGHKAVLVGAFGDVPVGIIGVRVPGGAVPRLRLVDLHLPGGAPGADVSICTKGLAIF